MARTRIARIVAVIAAGVGVTVAAAPASAATTVVTEISPTSTFTPGATRDTGTVAIGTTFGAPAGFGTGSLELSTPASNDKAQAVSTQAAGTLLSTFATRIGYATYRSSASTASPLQYPALNVEVDLNGAAAGGYTTLVYEPYYTVGSAALKLDTWQTWDAAQGRWWTTRPAAPFTATFGADTRLWSDVLAANPDAVIISVGINQGSGNAGLIAAADALVAGGLTIDFDPRVYTKDDCKAGGWQTNFPAGKYKNQGDCVSSFATTR